MQSAYNLANIDQWNHKLTRIIQRTAMLWVPATSPVVNEKHCFPVRKNQELHVIPMSYKTHNSGQNNILLFFLWKTVWPWPETKKTLISKWKVESPLLQELNNVVWASSG